MRSGRLAASHTHAPSASQPQGPGPCPSPTPTRTSVCRQGRAPSHTHTYPHLYTHTHAHARTPSAAAPEATGRRSVSGLLTFFLTATARRFPLQVSSRDANYSRLWAQQLTGCREGASAAVQVNSRQRRQETRAWKKKKKTTRRKRISQHATPGEANGLVPPEPSGKRSP